MEAVIERNIGKMRHRLALQTVVRNSDGGGGFTRADTTLATVYGSVMPASSREIYESSQLQERVTHTVMIRHRSDVVQGMTVQHDGRDLYVLSAVDPNQRKEFLKLMCREGGPG